MAKKILKILVSALVALPVIIYIAVVIANNSIANQVETDLKEYRLPEGTRIIDSLSAAGKLAGNGNGMQYMGSVLVSSDLTEEELIEHYSNGFDYIQVRKQETADLDFIDSGKYSFESFGDSNVDNCYSVTCWGSKSDFVGNGFFAALLDWDLRGY